MDPSLSGSHVIGLKLPYWIKNLMKPLIRRVDPRLVDIFMGERWFRLHPADQFRSICRNCLKLAPRVRLISGNFVQFLFVRQPSAVIDWSTRTSCGRKCWSRANTGTTSPRCGAAWNWICACLLRSACRRPMRTTSDVWWVGHEVEISAKTSLNCSLFKTKEPAL